MPDQLDLLHEPAPIGTLDLELARRGVRFVIGVDEVGRGPLAGPVTTAAVLVELERTSWCDGLNDSKKLSAQRRDELLLRVVEHAPACHWQHGSVETIDQLNILQASLVGMRQCAERILDEHDLDPATTLVLVDGNKPLPAFTRCRQQTVVRGDSRSWAIAAASIVAKVHRDREMTLLDARFPGYGLARHKGYPTATHLDAIRRLGPTPIHRRSFAPVRELLAAATPADAPSDPTAG